MKKVIVLIVGLVLSTTSVVANSDTPIAAKKELRTAIVKLLGNNEFPLTTTVATAEVSMLLNSNNELVIIAVKSDNLKLENYIKRKLNYKKVSVQIAKKMKIYKMPVKIIQS